ncbi:MAG: FecR domain-containing protein [Sphingomonas sp.]|uniref:FecR family protein n=1 Tax=Sphingomonas sp. TaxID=28214 RepID=UPI001B1652B3|nr:FecR domain-containing protein [Sphingomonas sp.]MBO9621233.1 FecR domain-containing protein [Sphingomonas sp.]
MASTGPTNNIADRAAEWAVEAAYGDMSPEARAALEAWLVADTRHRGAYMRARAWLRASEIAVVEEQAAPAGQSRASNMAAFDVAPSRPLRRGVVRWGGRALAGGVALAASMAALVAVGVPLPPPFGATEVAEAARVVKLKDGSVATLGRGAEIAVALSGDVRRVTLLRGEAQFKVAKDKARPFVVRSGDVYAQATGTLYSVTRVGETGGMVKVAEGSVLVWPRDERDQAVLLHPGGSLTLDPGPRRMPAPARATTPAVSRSRPLPPPELAQISLDDVPVKTGVARFNSLNSTKIVIADPTIADIRIVGLYRADDPEQFAQAVAAISDGVVVHDAGKIVVKLK